MKRLASCSALLLLLMLAVTPALAAGAWTNYIKTYSFTDVIAETDTVWCGTGEAGLLRFTRADGRFISYTRESNGIASNTIAVMTRDASRNLWVGTAGFGLSRLDPQGRWSLLNRFDGLPSDSVTSLLAVGDTLWIGTANGLAFWNGENVVGSLPDGVNPSPFRSNLITGIVEHGDSLWVSTFSGIYASSISSGLSKWVSADGQLPGTFSWSALVEDGVALYALQPGGAVARRPFGTTAWSLASPAATTYRLFKDGGAILATANDGIYRWNGAGWTRINAAWASDGSAQHTFAFALDPAGRQWGGDVNGLHEQPVSGPENLYAPPGPPGNFILNLGTDDGRVYVSTTVEGVGRFDGREWRLWPPVFCSAGCDTNFTIPQYPFALLVDSQHKKWFGMWQVAVEVLDDTGPVTQVTHNYYPPPTLDLRTNSWAAAADSVHGRWFGMDTNCLGCTGRDPLGLLYYGANGSDSLNFRPDSLPEMRGNKVHGLAVDHYGNVWVGYAGQGIQTFVWPAAHVRFNTVPGSENFDIQGIVAIKDSVWVMTTRDVRKYYAPTAAFIDSFLLPAVPADIAVNPLAVAKDGTVYVGTTSGVRVRHPDGTLDDFTTLNSPVPGNAVQAVRVDPVSGAVWIGTAAGLSRFDPSYLPPAPPPVATLEFSVYPNPSPLTAIGVGIRLSGNVPSYRGGIYDLTGRLLHTFEGVGNDQPIWDGRDRNGSLVRPGIYFVRVEAGGRSGTKRVALVR